MNLFIKFSSLILCIYIFSITIAPAIAQCEQQKLLPSGGDIEHYTGSSVDIENGVAAIGAYGLGADTVYIYRYNQANGIWEEQPDEQVLGISTERFGYSLDMDGDLLIVGAYINGYNGLQAGAAYIYRFDGTTWDKEATLYSSDPQPFDQYGSSVSISDNLAIVGAPQNGQTNRPGFVDLYHYDGISWSKVLDHLSAPDAQIHDRFGDSVAVNGSSFMVGAPDSDQDGLVNCGAVYRYDYDGFNWWPHQLLRSEPGAYHSFGNAVAFEGLVSIIGARGYNSATGSAYIFTEYAEEAMLEPDDGYPDYSFGFDVDIDLDGNSVVIGSQKGAGIYSRTGCAQVFKNAGSGNWLAEGDKIQADDGASEDNFGGSVAIEGYMVLAGALGDDNYRGSAYVFNLDGRPHLTITGTCPGIADIKVICATPGGEVAIIFGTLKKQYTLTDQVCPGTTIMVHPSKFLPGSPFRHTANGEGELSFPANVPPAVCDRIFIQAVDLTNCMTSNVVVF